MFWMPFIILIISTFCERILSKSLRLTETRNSRWCEYHFFSFIVWFLQVALFYVSVLISMFDIGDFFQMLSDPRLPLHSSVLRTEKETGSPMGAACAGWLLWPYCDLVQSLGDTWISYSSVGNRPGSQHSGISEGKIYRALNSQHRTFT